MQLLDAILAFSLTMAALATIVTVIMEASLRIASMRRKNLVEVMKLLNKELKISPLGMDENDRWEFFVKVVENPLEASIEKCRNEWVQLSVDERLAYFGRDKTAGKEPYQRFLNFIKAFIGDSKRKGLYEKVSLEHLLRSLGDSQTVREISLSSQQKAKIELNRLARKYEEFGSAVSVSFKEHAQQWSIIVGILLALSVNLNGLKIFDTYLTDPNLTAEVISKHEQFVNSYDPAHKNGVGIHALQAKITEITTKLEAKDLTEEKRAELNEQRKETESKIEEEATIIKIKQNVLSVQNQLAELSDLGIPIGWGNDFATTAPFKNGFPGFFSWLCSVILTGILIGLGAPFWFDIAKRLSQLRKGVQNNYASDEYRLSGSNANGVSRERKKIVKRVINDIVAEAKKDTIVTEKNN